MSAPQPEDMYTVSSVWRRSRNALAREFKHSVWIVGEIKTIREWRGNWYFTLIEPGGNSDGSDVTLDVACNPKRRLVIQSQLNSAGITLTAGTVVHVCGPVSIGRLGKLQVELISLDTASLIGSHALDRKRVVDALDREGLLNRNRMLSVPLVPLTIGLVGSDGSDGVKDFLGRLDASPYAFRVVMRHSPVQGPAAVSNLANAIRSLNDEDVDIVAVVRGGGGELDAFDKEPVVRSVAVSQHVVWTGIGHTADESLADRVANRTCVTPTACAGALIERVAQYADYVDGRLREINRVVRQCEQRARADVRHSAASLSRHAATWADRHHNRLESFMRHIHVAGNGLIDREQLRLRVMSDELTKASRRNLHSAQVDVSSMRQQVNLLDPARQLARGYAVVRTPDGKAVRNPRDVGVGDSVSISIGRGKLEATVTNAIDESALEHD